MRFCKCFIINFVMQHNMCCVNRIGRSLENLKCALSNKYILYGDPTNWAVVKQTSAY